MAVPPTFSSTEAYMEECVKFFKDYSFLLRYANTNILTQRLIDKINMENLDKMNLFYKEFDLKVEGLKDKYMNDFLTRLEELKVEEQVAVKRDIDIDINVPVSRKKRYEVLNLVREVEEVCDVNGCKVVVDYGSGLGYLDQILHHICGYKVLGIECHEPHFEGARNRQKNFFEESIAHVKFVNHTIEENSHIAVAEFMSTEFPDAKEFCLVGLHACADLTIEAMHTFIKMPDAMSMILTPCCYHRMVFDNGRFKNFPLSKTLKRVCDKYDTYEFMGHSFMRLACQGYKQRGPDLYASVFTLLTRALIELYATEHGYYLTRNRRKAVRLHDWNDFESYMKAATTKGFTLYPLPNQKPKGFSKEALENHEIVNNFDIDEIRVKWNEMLSDLTFKRTGVFILMQKYIQSLVENFVLVDRLMFLKEQGLSNCYYKKIFIETTSPRCMALIAHK